ncbi:MAG TPA: hypothetical protein IGR89_04590 [Oscillatoriaceae cyanobacterium M7585_C2015_266]|nr:hypothetical protein [Oscillatoriaceae cyanobacterium M7585_C2015_266]
MTWAIATETKTFLKPFSCFQNSSNLYLDLLSECLSFIVAAKIGGIIQSVTARNL